MIRKTLIYTKLSTRQDNSEKKGNYMEIIHFSCRYALPRRPTLDDLSLADLEDLEDLP